MNSFKDKTKINYNAIDFRFTALFLKSQLTITPGVSGTYIMNWRLFCLVGIPIRLQNPF